LVFKTFSTKEITPIIQLLKTKNSHGYKAMSTQLLNIGATYVCSPLTYICNTSFLSGIFPAHLKFEVLNYKTYTQERRQNESNKL